VVEIEIEIEIEIGIAKEEEGVVNEEEEVETPPGERSVVWGYAGRRAWGKLRLHIAEESMKKKNRESTLGWTFLKHTLKATMATDMKQVREDLYDRYITRPNSWTDGLIHCPEEYRRRLVREKCSKAYKFAQTKQI